MEHLRAVDDKVDLAGGTTAEVLDKEIDANLARGEALRQSILKQAFSGKLVPQEAVFPKNVGLLFFNERPHEFFPATQIDVVWFPDGPGGDYSRRRSSGDRWLRSCAMRSATSNAVT